MPESLNGCQAITLDELGLCVAVVEEFAEGDTERGRDLGERRDGRRGDAAFEFRDCRVVQPSEIPECSLSQPARLSKFAHARPDLVQDTAEHIINVGAGLCSPRRKRLACISQCDSAMHDPLVARLRQMSEEWKATCNLEYANCARRVDALLASLPPSEPATDPDIVRVIPPFQHPGYVIRRAKPGPIHDPDDAVALPPSEDAHEKEVRACPVRLVYVEWLDSFGCSSSWQKLDMESCEPMVCKSVGWLLHDGPTCKVIVPHVSGTTNEGCGDMTIPTVAVVRMTDIDLSGHAGLTGEQAAQRVTALEAKLTALRDANQEANEEVERLKALPPGSKCDRSTDPEGTGCCCAECCPYCAEHMRQELNAWRTSCERAETALAALEAEKTQTHPPLIAVSEQVLIDLANLRAQRAAQDATITRLRELMGEVLATFAPSDILREITPDDAAHVRKVQSDAVTVADVYRWRAAIAAAHRPTTEGQD